MDPRVAEEVSMAALFDQFVEASTMKSVLSIHHRILNYATLEPTEFNQFFPRFKRAVMSNRQRKNWKAKALFTKIDKRAAQRCYSNTKAPAQASSNKTTNNNNNNLSDIDHLSNNNNSNQDCIDDSLCSQNKNSNNALQGYNCLVIGSGPAGLRTAIELQLLGASKVMIVEKRSRFSRNNVLHLWPFVIDDLKSLGAKKFYGKFCAGSIDHISIRQLQLMLLKVCLMLGCDFRESCSYVDLCPASIKQPLPSASDEVPNSDNPTTTTTTTAPTSNESNHCQNAPKCDLDLDNELGGSVDPARMSANMPSSQQSPRTTDSTLQSHPPNSSPSETHVSSTTDSKSATVSARPQADEGQITSSTSNNSMKQHDASSPIKQRRRENLHGAKAHFDCDSKQQERELHSYEWDAIVGADGRRNTLSKFFPRKEFRGRLAIAITANFINRQTPIESSVPEISGLSFIYNQDMFNALAYDTNIQLENICYYKDDTHYFVMTAKKKSLLERGVLINDSATTQDLLSEANVNRQALLDYAKDAAFWTTGLEPLDFALNHYGQEDCAMFDFTSMHAASNACKALRTTRGGLTLISLVGDSLLEPFWPTGSGCARGFLSSFDAAWMCRQWAVNKCALLDYHRHNHHDPNSLSARSSRNRCSSASDCGDAKWPGNAVVNEPTTYNRMALSVMAERESIYRILAQTTSENLQQNYSHWTLNPHTRYPNLNRHLVLPSQVEHLISDDSTGTGKQQQLSLGDHGYGTTTTTRRVKSPNNNSRLKKSPKKLKSADASPVAQAKNLKARSRSLSRQQQQQQVYGRAKSQLDLGMDETYIEFEESYRNLADTEGGRPPATVQYLNHRRRAESEALDDLLIPSLSGTLPSSNNLLSLEARRARDIDECLRQRRQKVKINIVRDQLIGAFGLERGNGNAAAANGRSGDGGGGGNAALFSELRRLREQQAKSGRGDSSTRDVNSPLSLLCSMRRCASFAERVKSFESRLGGGSSAADQTDSSTATTPRTPIDDVRNLPQFATLQELFTNKQSKTNNGKDQSKRSRIPVTKLTKDDWNVKCWERRLTAFRQKENDSLAATRRKDFTGSTRSLGKALSVDHYATSAGIKSNGKPQKQVEVFRDRIKEMAEKLRVAKQRDSQTANWSGRGQNGLANGFQSDTTCPPDAVRGATSANAVSGRTQGLWVNHLKRQLVKGVESRRPQSNSNGTGTGGSRQRAMNPAVPHKPIKKLFEDDDDDEDGKADEGKHYDHLCVNRPTNKYLPKGAYTSHLVRTKYDSATSRVINRTKQAETRKQAYLATLAASHCSSASSTMSDYSTATTANSSSGDSVRMMSLTRQQKQQQHEAVVDMECFRCKKFVNSADRIVVGDSILHKACLTCAKCSISLRSNEIQHYLDLAKRISDAKDEVSFACAICEPGMRADLSKEFADGTAGKHVDGSGSVGGPTDLAQRRMQSREEFLNARINYNELYRNILDNDSHQALSKGSTSSASPQLASNGCLPVTSDTSSTNNSKHSPNRSASSESNDSGSNGEAILERGNTTRQTGGLQEGKSEFAATGSPVKIVTGSPCSGRGSGSTSATKLGYRIAESETIDGSEQVTLILPSNSISKPATPERLEIDCGGGDSTRDNSSKQREMIDEEELQRILHLDKPSTAAAGRRMSADSSSSDDDTAPSRATTASSEEEEADAASATRRRRRESELLHKDNSGCGDDDDSSSLNSPPNTEDYDDDEEGEEEEENNVDRNSTYEDFITSEEFDAISDRDDDGDLSGNESPQHANGTAREGTAAGCKASQVATS